MAQISNGISNPVVAGIVYWLIRILICGDVYKRQSLIALLLVSIGIYVVNKKEGDSV